MKMRKYPDGYIYEFDSIDELREFDDTYRWDTRSVILKAAAARLGGTEAEITQIRPIRDGAAEAAGVQFLFRAKRYAYTYHDQSLGSI
jgi:hypothetical protein